jgi:hypothetical protein
MVRLALHLIKEGAPTGAIKKYYKGEKITIFRKQRRKKKRHIIDDHQIKGLILILIRRRYLMISPFLFLKGLILLKIDDKNLGRRKNGDCFRF